MLWESSSPHRSQRRIRPNDRIYLLAVILAQKLPMMKLKSRTKSTMGTAPCRWTILSYEDLLRACFRLEYDGLFQSQGHEGSPCAIDAVHGFEAFLAGALGAMSDRKTCTQHNLSIDERELEHAMPSGACFCFVLAAVASFHHTTFEVPRSRFYGRVVHLAYAPLGSNGGD